MSHKIVPLDDFINEHQIEKNDAYNIISSLRDRFGVFDIHNGIWIAGGAVLAMLDGRSMIKRDVDMFFANKKQASTLHEIIKDQLIVRNTVTTNNALTLSTKFETLQLITKKYYSSPFEVIDSFDINVCQFITDGEYLAYSDAAYEGWQNKTLQYLRPKEHVSLLRIFKYSLQGYTCDSKTMSDVLTWVRDTPEFFYDDGGYPS